MLFHQNRILMRALDTLIPANGTESRTEKLAIAYFRTLGRAISMKSKGLSI